MYQTLSEGASPERSDTVGSAAAADVVAAKSARSGRRRAAASTEVRKKENALLNPVDRRNDFTAVHAHATMKTMWLRLTSAETYRRGAN